MLSHWYFYIIVYLRRIDKAKLAAPRGIQQLAESPIASGAGPGVDGYASVAGTGPDAGQQAAGSRQHVVEHPNGCELVLNQYSTVHEVPASDLQFAEDVATCAQFAFTPLSNLCNLPDRALIGLLSTYL